MKSYCGLICNSCSIHLATLEKDESKQRSMRIEIASICREKYGMNLRYEDITDCDGCRVDGGRLFSGCLSCEIRACASNRMIESCANCNDYPCLKLDRIFQEDPEARVRLEKIRNQS
jgi:hypothetical protein